ncbi:MAG TPA: RNA ligase [Tepidisphaeraceae bacterium]
MSFSTPGPARCIVAFDHHLIRAVYGRHPAREMPFDQLHAGLMAAERNQNVVVSRAQGLEQFMYTNGCRFENRWDVFSLISRGLILDTAAKRVVATPFPKFFNFGELFATLPDEPFEVTEKIDGSLGVLFHHAGRWRVATKGSLISDQAAWATDYVAQRVDVNQLVPGTTYLVEIVYRLNRIVIKYDFEELILLGAYDESGCELPRSELQAIATNANLRLVAAHSYSSVDQLLELARGLPRDREGFVLKFGSGLRIKLKGEQYCRIHKLISQCTPLALWEAMSNAENLDQLRLELPEEMTRDFDLIRGVLDQRLAALVSEVQAAVARTSNMDNKAVGLLVQDTRNWLTPVQRKFLFQARKAQFFERLHESGECRRRAFALLRPDRNELPGYEPTNAMTRFQHESG